MRDHAVGEVRGGGGRGGREVMTSAAGGKDEGRPSRESGWSDESGWYARQVVR